MMLNTTNTKKKRRNLVLGGFVIVNSTCNMGYTPRSFFSKNMYYFLTFLHIFEIFLLCPRVKKKHKNKFYEIFEKIHIFAFLLHVKKAKISTVGHW